MRLEKNWRWLGQDKLEDLMMPSGAAQWKRVLAEGKFNAVVLRLNVILQMFLVINLNKSSWMFSQQHKNIGDELWAVYSKQLIKY